MISSLPTGINKIIAQDLLIVNTKRYFITILVIYAIIRQELDKINLL